jgi:mannosyltransferase
MSFIQRIAKRLPSTPNLPFDDSSREKARNFSRFAFLKRRIRLKGNSSISIPLGFVLLFPCLVIILILLLFVRHPSSPGGILIPAGTPPSIRFDSHPQPLHRANPQSYLKANVPFFATGE